MKVLVIGTGSIGSRHAQNIASAGHDVETYDPMASCTLRSVWRGVTWRPHAVVVATPAETHADVVTLLAAYGYDGPLFVEKPICMPGHEAVFARWPHPTTMVGYNLRWHGDRIFDAVLRRADGIKSSELTLACDMSAWPSATYTDGLLECSHEIDLALQLSPGVLVDAFLNDWSALLVFERAVVDLDWMSKTLARRWVIRMESGAVLRDGIEGSHGPPVESYAAEMAHFLSCAMAGAPTDCSFAAGLAVLDIYRQAGELATRRMRG